MTDKLLIKVKCLKDLLTLFDKEQKFDSLTFGDTWHLSSGFVDESILEGKNHVIDILNIDYDFEGLVGFEAEIGEITIRLLTYPNEDRELEEYLVSGPMVELRSIYNKVIAQNAYHPNKYHSHFMSEWE
jgi:hypothetical protein